MSKSAAAHAVPSACQPDRSHAANPAHKPADTDPLIAAALKARQPITTVLKELRQGADEFEFEVRAALGFAMRLYELNDHDIQAFSGQQIVMLRHFVNYASLFDDSCRKLQAIHAD